MSKCAVDVESALAGGYRMKLHAGPGLLGGGKTDKEVKFILDEDLSANGSLSADSVPGKLEDLHRYAVRLFRGAITPELHNALGPTPRRNDRPPQPVQRSKSMIEIRPPGPKSWTWSGFWCAGRWHI